MYVTKNWTDLVEVADLAEWDFFLESSFGALGLRVGTWWVFWLDVEDVIVDTGPSFVSFLEIEKKNFQHQALVWLESSTSTQIEAAESADAIFTIVACSGRSHMTMEPVSHDPTAKEIQGKLNHQTENEIQKSEE